MMDPQDRIELTWHRSLVAVPPARVGWYARERRKIYRLADRFDVDRERTIVAASALSPRVPWPWVLEKFLPVLLAGSPRPAGCFRRSWNKAWRILSSTDVPWVEVLDRRTAPKTYDFVLALLGAPLPVIDTWAAKVALGRRLRSRAEYDIVSDYYKEVAARLWVRPDVLQATCWEGVRDYGVSLL